MTKYDAYLMCEANHGAAMDEYAPPEPLTTRQWAKALGITLTGRSCANSLALCKMLKKRGYIMRQRRIAGVTIWLWIAPTTQGHTCKGVKPLKNPYKYSRLPDWYGRGRK